MKKQIIKHIISFIMIIGFSFIILSNINTKAYLKVKIGEGEKSTATFERVTSNSELDSNCRYVLVSLLDVVGRETYSILSTYTDMSGYRAGSFIFSEDSSRITVDAYSTDQATEGSPLFFRMNENIETEDYFGTNSKMYNLLGLVGEYDEASESFDNSNYYLSPFPEEDNKYLPLLSRSEKRLSWFVYIQDDGSCVLYSYDTTGSYSGRKQWTFMISEYGDREVYTRFYTGNLNLIDGKFQSSIYLYKEVCTHDDMTHIDEVPATCSKEGSIGYYYCPNCQGEFLDEEGLNPLTTDKTIPTIAHSYVNGKCVYCNKELEEALFATGQYLKTNIYTYVSYIITYSSEGMEYALSNESDRTGIKGSVVTKDKNDFIHTNNKDVAFLSLTDNLLEDSGHFIIQIDGKYLGYKYDQELDKVELGFFGYDFTFKYVLKELGVYEIIAELDKPLYLTFENGYFTLTEKESTINIYIETCTHNNIKYYPKKDATCDEEGNNISYWYCQDCNRYFTTYNDEAIVLATDDEIANLHTKALGHNYNEANVCTKCGLYAPVYREVTNNTQLGLTGTYIIVSEYEGKTYAFGLPEKMNSDTHTFDYGVAIEVKVNDNGEIVLGNSKVSEFKMIKDTRYVSSHNDKTYQLKSIDGYLFIFLDYGFHLVNEEYYTMPVEIGFNEDEAYVSSVDVYDILGGILEKDELYLASIDRLVFACKKEDVSKKVSNIKLYYAPTPLKAEEKEIVIEDSDSTSVSISKESWDEFLSSDNLESIEIKTSEGSIEYDKKAMETIASSLGLDDVVTVLLEKDFNYEEVLTLEQKDLIASSENVYAVYNIVIKSGDIEIHNFNGGKATISIKYNIPNDVDPSEVVVVRVNNDGTTTEFETTYTVDPITHEGILSWTSDTHSVYMVTKTETGSRPKPATIDANPPKDYTWLWITIGIIGAGTLAGVGFFLIKKKLAKK